MYMIIYINNRKDQFSSIQYRNLCSQGYALMSYQQVEWTECLLQLQIWKCIKNLHQNFIFINLY